MKHIFLPFFIICFLSSTLIIAQTQGDRLDISFKKMNGDDYSMPFIGGFNNPQFSEADFNNDGILDLLVFDKTGDIPVTFINNGTPNQVDYSFEPKYADNFPRNLHSWGIMADYNNDGAYDLFTYSNTPGIPGIEVHRGYFNDDNELAFTLVQNFINDYDLLSYPHSSGLDLEIYAANVDIPVFIDTDKDGDMDVMNFSQLGNKLEYFKNQSVELGFGADSLIFEQDDFCWGLFIESGTSADIMLSNNPNQCADLNLSINTGLHAGSTLAMWDNDDDGDWEILVGDVTVNSLSYLNNTGSGLEEYPWFNALDETFPSYSTPVDIPLFAAPFVLDVNNDGRKDLIASPNDQGASVNVDVSWYYENTTDAGLGNFNLVQKDFLVNDCVDLGQGAKPAFFDYNADGLLDIVVGTDGFFVELGLFDTRLVLFENIGTADTPAFQLVDDDYLGFSQYTDRALAPAFGDLDGDGDQDMIVAQTDGDLFYAENTGGNNAAIFNTIIPEYKSIGGGQKCVASIGDIDNDGLADIITGYKQGRIAFFKNTGTIGNPDFEGDKSLSPNIDGLGDVDVRVENLGIIDQRGYASPKLFFVDGNEPHIITGNFFSTISVYNNILDNISGTFNQVSSNYGNIFEGHVVALDIADIDNDGYFEIVVGNQRGGFGIFDTEFISDSTLDDQEIIAEDINLTILPNPANEIIQIHSNIHLDELEIDVLDINGRWIQKIEDNNQLFIGDLPAGIYFLSIKINQQIKMEKFIKL